MRLGKEVADALAQKKPVVALESTLISHGMPYPQNVETGKMLENGWFFVSFCGVLLVKSPRNLLFLLQ